MKKKLMSLLGAVILLWWGIGTTFAAPEERNLDFTTIWENETTMQLSGVEVDFGGEKASTLSISFPREASISSETAPSTWTNRTYSSGALSYMTPANNSAAEIKSFLESLRFVGEKNTTTGEIIVDIFDRQLSFRIDESWDYHFYEFITTPAIYPIPSHQTRAIAYTLAQQSTFRGLTGYLATTTSDEELNFIYSISTKTWRLWGTRAIKKGGGDRIINDQSITWDNLNINATQGANKWYWASGPEAWEQFYSTANRNTSEGATSVGKNLPYYYRWNGSSPDNCAGIEAYLMSNEHSSIGRNDAACGWNNNTQKGFSYFIEYSGKEFTSSGTVPHTAKIPYLDLTILSPTSWSVLTSSLAEFTWKGEVQWNTLSGYAYTLTQSWVLVASWTLWEQSLTIPNLSNGSYQFDLTMMTTSGESFTKSSTFSVKLPLYTLTFLDDDWITVLTTGAYLSGATIIPPTNLSKTGFIFNGWENLPTDHLMPATHLSVKALRTKKSTGWASWRSWWGGSSSQPSTPPQTPPTLPDTQTTNSWITSPENNNTIHSWTTENQSLNNITGEKKILTRGETAILAEAFINQFSQLKAIRKIINTKCEHYADQPTFTDKEKTAIKTVCIRWVMGIHDDTKKPLTAFESERGIPTSEFSTVLSRILYQYKYDNNGNGAYYATHYKAMKENNFVNSPLDKIQTYNDALASFSKAAKTLKSWESSISFD